MYKLPEPISTCIKPVQKPLQIWKTRFEKCIEAIRAYTSMNEYRGKNTTLRSAHIESIWEGIGPRNWPHGRPARPGRQEQLRLVRGVQGMHRQTDKYIWRNGGSFRADYQALSQKLLSYFCSLAPNKLNAYHLPVLHECVGWLQHCCTSYFLSQTSPMHLYVSRKVQRVMNRRQIQRCF